MKVVAVDSAVLAVPTPKPMALEFREHRLVVAPAPGLAPRRPRAVGPCRGHPRQRFPREYMDWMPSDLFVDVPRPDLADGLVRIPDRPGHGMALVPGAERKYRLR